MGYLRDIRRLTVALSRARLGLYILGRRAVFESCYELSEATKILFERPDKLQLVHGELYPTTRTLDDEPDSNEMDGVEHIGQYVYEMTQARIAAMTVGSGQSSIPKAATEDVDIMEVENDGTNRTDAYLDEFDE